MADIRTGLRNPALVLNKVLRKGYRCEVKDRRVYLKYRDPQYQHSAWQLLVETRSVRDAACIAKDQGWIYPGSEYPVRGHCFL